MEKRIVFGPVPSRRLGQSLGINNIPPKFCSYSCVYCQIGKTINYATERREFYSVEKIVGEVVDILKKLKEKKERVDYISFVPDGEPTLDINLGKEIEALKQFNIPVAVITNSSLLWKPDVREDTKKADLVSLKIDTIDKKIWEKLNKPAKDLSIERILEGIKKFFTEFKGTLITETLIIKDINDEPEDIKKTAEFISMLKPSIAYIGIPTRPPAEKWVIPPVEEKIFHAYEIFNGYRIKTELITGRGSGSFGFTGNIEQDIVNTVSVHPMSKPQIEELLQKAGDCWTVMEKLLKEEKIKEIEYQEERYYIKNFSK